jgi:hypothetical protein
VLRIALTATFNKLVERLTQNNEMTKNLVGARRFPQECQSFVGLPVMARIRNRSRIVPFLDTDSQFAARNRDVHALTLKNAMAKRGDAELILDEIVDLDVEERKLLFANRESLPFDALSIGVGSMPVG